MHPCSTSEREGGGPLIPYPHSLCGAGLSEVAQAVRLSWRRVHLALRCCSQRPYNDRMGLDFRQSSFRHVTRVSPSNGFSIFSPLSALSAGFCSLALSGRGEPLTQGSPLNPSHLRWGCCMNYCGAPDAVSRQVQALVRRGFWQGLRPRVSAPVIHLWATDSDSLASLKVASTGLWSLTFCTSGVSSTSTPAKRLAKGGEAKR